MLGCGGEPDEEAEGFSDSPLQGAIDDQPWSFVAGQARTTSYASTPEDKFLVADFFPSAFSQCGDYDGGGQPSLRVEFEIMLGEQEYVTGTHFRYNAAGDSLPATQPVTFVRIDTITPTSITGAVRSGNGGSRVNGTFEIPNCDGAQP